MRHVTGMIVIGLLISCDGKPADAERKLAPAASVSPVGLMHTGSRTAPLVALLAVPERWDHVRVDVDGFLAQGSFELCLVQEYHELGVAHGCVKIDSPRCPRGTELPRRLHDELAVRPTDYAFVSGIFLQLPSGAADTEEVLCDVTDVRPHLQPFYGRPASSVQ